MNVPEHRQCGAKTRDGDPCKNWGILPSGRCRMHGGKSLRGIASRTFIHGRYSRDGLGRLMWDYSDEAFAESRRIYEEYKAELVAYFKAEREAREARKAARRRPWVLSEEVMNAIADEVVCSDEAVWSGEFLVSLADAYDTEGDKP